MVPKESSSNTDHVPLCVDLDGTLLRTDVFVESICSVIKKHFVYLFVLPWWLLQGKARFKYEIAKRATLDVTTLPYERSLLNFLKEQKQTGRCLVLATAANEQIAARVADHLGLFDKVLASDKRTNLAGRVKLQCLQRLFGDRQFDYAGNGSVDLAIWRCARHAILVDPSRELEHRVAGLTPVSHVFREENSLWRPYWEALRPQQWLKNILVFVPLFAAHRVDEWLLWGQGVFAFLAFSFCASSVYVLNDLIDLPADRRHPRKRARPFAAGRASVIGGVFLIPTLLVAGGAVAAALPPIFWVVLTGYYILSLCYSLGLKEFLLLDVLVLAGLYTLRVLAGSAAMAIDPSFWLLALSVFLFLSLAMVKRYTELLTMLGDGRQETLGRGYQVVDLDTLLSLGTASGYVAVLVLALYIQGEQVETLYARPQAIWLLCPLLLYWIGRIWLLAKRGDLHDDPMVFALGDPTSWWVAAGAGGVILLAL